MKIPTREVNSSIVMISISFTFDSNSPFCCIIFDVFKSYSCPNVIHQMTSPLFITVEGSQEPIDWFQLVNFFQSGGSAHSPPSPSLDINISIISDSSQTVQILDLPFSKDYVVPISSMNCKLDLPVGPSECMIWFSLEPTNQLFCLQLVVSHLVHWDPSINISINL
jgi:hypothetical protein